MTWTCLRVQPRQERRVVSLLQEQGTLAYAPMEVLKIVVKHPHHPERRRVVPRTRALMPTYVFVDITCDDDVDAISSIRPKPKFMANAYGRPIVVPPQDIGVLILMDAFKLFDETWEPPKQKGYQCPWKPGQKVKGKSGWVKDWIGTVLEVRGRHAVEVSFSPFGKPQTIKVDDDNLTQYVEPQGLACVAA